MAVVTGSALGQHALLEFHDCDRVVLADCARIRDIFLESARRAEATLVSDTFHSFSPHGVSGVVVIAESHVAVHTWPEHGYAAVDIFTCGTQIKADVLRAYLAHELRATDVRGVTVPRGVLETNPVARRSER